ncbi:MAG: methionine--tRNA ligase [Spirochaetaceae bacterium]|jgi:methionyl-tRNA synthetase|nr:methionine--tRNA ligase [Spirochaetaceae bacterium]
MKRRLITSALPYVNNVPHLGNLIQVLSADGFARFCRLREYDTLYVCGTDEYGTATENKAAEEGVSPQELCDRYHALHADIYRWFAIDFDIFGRTSTPVQTEIVQDIFKKLDAKGLVKEHTIEQLHCARCGRFLADRYVRGVCPHCGYAEARGDQCEICGKLLDPTDLKEPKCARCGAAPSLESTKHLYIDLPQIKGPLEAWLKDASAKGFWAYNALQMTQAWIRDGLRERAITRDLKWGIPVPKTGYEEKVFYVWFDAPIGYISITGSLGARTQAGWRAFVDRWWKAPEEVELFQFIGKDNIPFHTVIFPSSLLGTGEKWTMLHHMSSTEYLNYESGKFSKSKGVGVFGTDAMETGIAPDLWRFYIFYNRPEKADALFTWKDFQEKVNGELIGNLGNLVNRTLSFVGRYYQGAVPKRSGNPRFWEELRGYEARITEKLERAELRDAFRAIFELSSFANKAFQDGAPWRARTEDPPAAETLIRDLCYAVRDIGIMIRPYMPGAAEKIISFFGLRFEEDRVLWRLLGVDGGLEKVVKSEVLFARLEDDKAAALRERYAGAQRDRAGAASPSSPLFIEKTEKIEKIEKTEKTEKPEAPRLNRTLDLRAAQIVKAEPHPKADKLFILTLEIAGEERVIVSGLIPHYTAEALIGKRIIVAYNLKSAKLRGVASRGMLLAASDTDDQGRERVEVLDAGNAPTGTRALLAGEEAGAAPEEITIETFKSVPLRVRDYCVESEGAALCLAGEPVRAGVIANGAVQ